MEFTNKQEPDLWLDRFAQYFGLGWLGEAIPGNLAPSYLYTIVTISLSYVFTASYNLANGVTLVYTENPYFVLQPLILIGAVYGAHSLNADYDRVMEEMQIAERATSPDSLLSPVPSWLPWTLFAIGAGLQITRAMLLDLSSFGLTDYLANFFIFPFVFVPIVIQFFIVYISIEFIAPWRLSKSDVSINFLDRQGVGGLRPIGELVKKAYYYVVLGLVAYALVIYTPFVDSTWNATAADQAIFTIIWVVSVGTVAFAVYTLHRFMHREKRNEIHRLETRLQDFIQNPWDVQSYQVPEDKEAEVADLRERIDRVSATSEYPATFSIWTQLVLSIILPKAIQLFLAAI